MNVMAATGYKAGLYAPYYLNFGQASSRLLGHALSGAIGNHIQSENFASALHAYRLGQERFSRVNFCTSFRDMSDSVSVIGTLHKSEHFAKVYEHLVGTL